MLLNRLIKPRLNLTDKDFESIRNNFACSDEYILTHVSNFREVKRVKDVIKIFSKVNALRSKGRVWKFEGLLVDENEEKIAESIWCATIMDKNK